MRARVAALLLLALGCDRGALGSSVDGAELAERWGRASRCLIGDEPLAKGEKASERMARSELTLLAQGGPQGWPASCTPLIDETLALLDGAGSDTHAEFRSALRLLAGTQPDMFLSGGDAKHVDRLFAAAAEIPAVDVGEGPTAPPPAAPASTADLTLLGKSEGLIERVELAPSNQAVGFALGDAKAGALACLLRGPSLTKIQCDAIEDERTALFRPLSSENSDDRFYWDFKPTPAVFEIGGERIEMPSGASAFVFAGGVIGDVVDERPRPILARRLASGRIQRAPLRAPPGARMLGYRAGALLWRGPKRGHGVSPLIVQDVRPGRVALTGELEIGEIAPTVEHLIACRHDDRLTIALLADEAAEGDDIAVEVVTRVGTRWHKPIRTSAPLGKRFRKDESWWRELTCRADGASLTFLREDGRIGQLRCSEESCESALSEPVAAHGKVASQRVTALGDRVLLLQAVTTMAPMTGVTDMVVMRLAPLADIATAPTLVLIGDEEHDGVAGVGAAVGLVGGGEAAVALVRSRDAVYGLHVDAAGKLSKLAK